MQRRAVIQGAMGGIMGGLASAAQLVPAHAAGILPVPPSGKLGFAVLRDGNKVGEQHLIFTTSGDQLRVDIAVKLVVSVMSIPVFTYSCMATEHWSAGVFCGLDSYVNQNGTRLEVHASPIPGGFAIKSTKAGDYNYTDQPGLLPLTYWNKAMLNAMILNIETGRHYPAIVHSPGWNYLPAADGSKLLAQRFDVTGKLHLSVWYDQSSQWDGLDFVIFGGEMTFQKFSA